MARIRCVEELVQEFQNTRPIRGGSLIITVYGDAIAARGGTVWLGSLISLLASLGLNQRLVRTSVFRLSREGWLTSRQVGRRSFYSISEVGQRRFENAFKRIYAKPQVNWDGVWRIVITTQIENAQREALRAELTWMGFGVIAPGVLAHPMVDIDSVMSTLQELGLKEEVIILQARSDMSPSLQPLKRLVRECWNLEQLSLSYRRFLDRFRPVWKALVNAQDLEPEQCFKVRTLLIHQYRRILLRDPQLPEELLPTDWEGTSARLLCSNLYRLVQGPAEQHLSRVLETADGPLPEAVPYFYERFGGLREADVLPN
jgi:phenylacetic acid degradation operon negative regulatory protein